MSVFIVSPESSTADPFIYEHVSPHDRGINNTLERFTRYQIALWLNLYSTPIIAVIAFVCNSATLLTILYLKPITTSSIFVATLAISDFLSILLKLIMLEITNADIRMFDYGCGFMNTFGGMLVQYSNWVVVFMTSERFVAIWFPFRVSETITKKRVFVSLACLGAVLLAINLQFIWLFEERYHDTIKWSCDVSDGHVWYYQHVWYWINVLIYALIPCVSLAILNGLIIARLRKAFKEQRNIANSDTIDSQRQAQVQLTGMLVVVSVSLVIMLTPICVFHIVSVNWNYRKSLSETATYVLVQQVVFCVANLSHALNFVFYFLSSRKFRRVFVRRLRCQSRRVPMHSVSRTGNNRSMVTTTFITRMSDTNHP